MKKKIKDMTIEELISIARKANDLQKCSGDACSECPFANVEDLECWHYCSEVKYLRERIDNIINQEIEVEEDG